MIPDPPVRDDGRCANRGCKKPLASITARHRRYGGEALLSEPFCSTECCRAYHGNPYPEGDNKGAYDITRKHGGSTVVHGTRESYRLCACDLCTAAVKGAPA